jgi:hypothetical protein
MERNRINLTEHTLDGETVRVGDFVYEGKWLMYRVEEIYEADCDRLTDPEGQAIAQMYHGHRVAHALATLERDTYYIGRRYFKARLRYAKCTSLIRTGTGGVWKVPSVQVPVE